MGSSHNGWTEFNTESTQSESWLENDWPESEARVDNIGRNGNEGLHYKEVELPSKYHRKIKGTVLDVYDITEGYSTSHAIHHAIKKLLMAGNRGAKGRKQDLLEAILSIHREIEREEV